MEALFSFISQHSQAINIIVSLIVGYFILRLEPFKIRDKQFEKDIREVRIDLKTLTDFVNERERNESSDCVDCRRQIDSATDTDRNEITSFHGRFDTLEAKINGRFDLLEAQMEKHDQFYYETEAWMTSKKEILAVIANVRLELEVVRKDLEALNHRVSLSEVDG
jgi:hypothetical protein